MKNQVIILLVFGMITNLFAIESSQAKPGQTSSGSSVKSSAKSAPVGAKIPTGGGGGGSGGSGAVIRSGGQGNVGVGRPNSAFSPQGSSGRAAFIDSGRPSAKFAVNAFSTRSIQDSAATRLRASIPMPTNSVLPSNARNSPRSYGLLEPTFFNFVFSPAYFWLPMNLWHVHPSQSSLVYNSATQGYSLPPAPLNAVTQSLVGHDSARRASSGLYQNGEVGSSEINQLPEWIQATMRLMHTKQASPLPSDVIIKPLKLSVQEWTDQYKIIQAGIEELEKDHQAILDNVKIIKQVASAKTEIAFLEKQKPTFEGRVRVATEKKTQVNSRFLQEQEKIALAKTRFEAAEGSEGTVCRYSGYFCGAEFLNSDKELKELTKNHLATKSDLQKATDDLGYAEGELKKVDVAYDQFKTLVANSGNLPTVDEIKAKAAGNQEKLKSEVKKLQDLAGFVVFDSSGTRFSPATKSICSGSIYQYHFAKEYGASQHPLFADKVEAELLPDDGADLLVCLNENGKLTSLHLVQNKQEIYSTQIERNQLGQISRLSLLNQTGQPLEDHTWAPSEADPRSIHYGQRFIHGEEMFAITTEFSLNK